MSIDPVILLSGFIFLIAIVSTAFLIGRKGVAENGPIAETLHRLVENQAELTGRLAQMAEQNATGQMSAQEKLQSQERALTKMLDDRLSQMTQRVGDSLHQQSTKTEQTMGDLKERLMAINTAQDRITKLSEQVVTLQDILSNKQARGGFGELQLEDQVKMALPPNIYKFQETLSNKSRVDCLLTLPKPPGPIAVDSKFPLESFNAIRATPDDNNRFQARKAFGQDVLRHVKDIAGKYIIPEETADCALMFLPSEAVYAELHAELPEIIEKSHQQRVYIVSPTTLMALLNTIRAVLKDTEMREQAGLIQKQVQLMHKDVVRLDERVTKLGSHFNQATKDIDEIQKSTHKITAHAKKIDAVELSEIDTLDASQSTGITTSQEERLPGIS